MRYLFMFSLDFFFNKLNLFVIPDNLKIIKYYIIFAFIDLNVWDINFKLFIVNDQILYFRVLNILNYYSNCL